MVIASHLKIAKQVHQYILEETGFELDLVRFMYGNIKPDVRRNDFKVGHYFDTSIDLIEDIAKETMADPKSMEELSEKLGVISHFVADYFCEYHFDADKKEEPILKHIAYELALHRTIKSYIKEDAFLSVQTTCNGIKDMITQMRNQYTGQRASYRKDAAYALLATKSIVKALVSEYVESYITVAFVASINELNEQAA